MEKLKLYLINFGLVINPKSTNYYNKTNLRVKDQDRYSMRYKILKYVL